MQKSSQEAGLGNLVKTSEFLEVDQDEEAEQDEREDESVSLPQEEEEEEAFEDAKAADEAEVTVDADDEEDEDADDLVVADQEEIGNDSEEAKDTATLTEYDAAEPASSCSAEGSTCGRAAEAEDDIPAIEQQSPTHDNF